MGKKLVTSPDITSRTPRWLSALGVAALAILFGLGALMVGVASWIRRTFGPISVDQMLMNLPGAGGAETTTAEASYIAGFVWQALVFPLLLVLLGLFLVLAIRRRPQKAYAVAPKRSRLEQISRKVRLRRWAPTLMAFGVVAVGVSMVAQSIGASQYFRSATTSLSMSDYYVSPVATPSQHPRNLVTIYLESMEDAFADDSMFEENMLKPVEQATRDWEKIDHLRQFDGGGWTMAGIVGTQCGLPLRGVQAAKAGELQNIGLEELEFMPGATCLGDVLSEAGYKNVFMGGADAQFASKEHYLRSHGYDEVLDLHTWLSQGEEEASSWGLSDRALFEQAKSEVSQLHDSAQPFNLTLLTLDTHEPAHAFEYCPITTEEEMTSITRCSLEQVADFIQYLDSQGILDDTAVVLMGDHEKFVSDGSSYQELLNIEDRTIFNRIWSPDEIEISRSDIDQLSMFATMLELVGMKVEDRAAGVGISAFYSGGPASGLLALSPEEYAEVVQSRSASLYGTIWGLAGTEQIQAGYFDPKNPELPAGDSGTPVRER